MARIRLRHPRRRVRGQHQRVQRTGRVQRRLGAPGENRRPRSLRQQLPAGAEQGALRRRPLRVDTRSQPPEARRHPQRTACLPDQTGQLRRVVRLQRPAADAHLVHGSLHRAAEPAERLFRGDPHGAQRPPFMDGRRLYGAGRGAGRLRQLPVHPQEPALHLDAGQRHRQLLALLGAEPAGLLQLYGRCGDARPADRKRLPETRRRLRPLRHAAPALVLRLGRAARGGFRSPRFPGAADRLPYAGHRYLAAVRRCHAPGRQPGTGREIRALRRRKDRSPAPQSPLVRGVGALRCHGCRQRRVRHARRARSPAGPEFLRPPAAGLILALQPVFRIAGIGVPGSLRPCAAHRRRLLGRTIALWRHHLLRGVPPLVERLQTFRQRRPGQQPVRLHQPDPPVERRCHQVAERGGAGHKTPAPGLRPLRRETPPRRIAHPRGGRSPDAARHCPGIARHDRAPRFAHRARRFGGRILHPRGRTSHRHHIPRRQALCRRPYERRLLPYFGDRRGAPCHPVRCRRRIPPPANAGGDRLPHPR